MPQHIKPDPIKHCLYCQKLLRRRRMITSGTLEGMKEFRRRKYCDRTCMGLARMHEAPKRWAVQKRVLKFLKASCEHCGTLEKLSIHHIDRDWRNNDPANLQTLCTSCHTSLHHRQGDIKPKKTTPPCEICGKPSYRLGLCHTHRMRLRTHGSPYLTRIRNGAGWLLVEDRG
jgi:hypothetical protein